MTGAIPLWSDVSDGDLVPAAAEGDRQAFAEIYDRYADRLYDFCVGMIGDRDVAADCVQDAFCVAATGLNGLRDPDKLRPWLYSIARHHAMRRLRHRYREEVSDAVPDMASDEAGPDTMAGQSELARLVAEAADGLSDRDRNLLELSYRHGLDGPELAEVLGVSLTSANSMVFRLRQTVERSLGALLVARDARTNTKACPELKSILKGWDGQLTVLMRKRIARHIESCHLCQKEQRRRVNPVALLGGAPLFIPAPEWMRDQTLDRVQLSSESSTASSTADHPDSTDMTADDPDKSTADRPDSATTTPDDADSMSTRSTADHPDSTDMTADDPDKSPRNWVRAAVLVGIPLIALGTTIVWSPPPQDSSITPAVDSQTNPNPDNGPAPLIAEVTDKPSATAAPRTVPASGTTRTPLPTQQSQTVPEVSTPVRNPDIPYRNPEIDTPSLPEIDTPSLPENDTPVPYQNVDPEDIVPAAADPEESDPEKIDPEKFDPGEAQPEEADSPFDGADIRIVGPAPVGLDPSASVPINPSMRPTLNPSVRIPVNPSGGGDDDSSGGGGEPPPR